MKKIYTLAVCVVAAFTLNAQNQTRVNGPMPANVQVLPNQQPQVIHFDPNSPQAQGDTVFVFDGYYVYDWNATLPGTFTIQTEDIDGAQVATPLQSSAFGPTSDWVFFYEENPTSNLHYAHPDSVFFGGACSWFAPVGQASNWLEMGPITVPAAGGVLWWRHNMPDGNYRDGYEVLVNTTSVNSSDFTNPPVYTVSDMDASTALDTANTPYNVFAQRTTDLSAYAGQDIYIAFHHNANDMFILYITDVILTEGPVTVEETNTVNIASAYPSPANTNTTIAYSLPENTDVTITVTDVTGKVVYTENLGNQAAGLNRTTLNTENWSSGMYFYTISTANGSSATDKISVQH